MRQAIAIVVLLAGTSAMADVIKLQSSPFSAGVGGEFRATAITGNAGITGLPADLSANSFQTFCLEHNENFRSGDNYSFVINTGAIQGGVSGQTSPGFDPLDARTAFLYHNFRYGTLAGYDYSVGGRQGSAAALQQAIWFIEGEGGSSNAFVTLAQNAVDSGAWVGLGSVRVLNLSNAEFPHAQDQLTILPLIPTPGAAVLASLGCVVALRRRR